MSERNPQETVARVVRWALMLFFAYAILYNLPRFGIGTTPATAVPDPSVTLPAVPAKAQAKDCPPTGNAFSNFSLFAMPMFPVSSPRVIVSDLKEGTGELATCGQRATLRYTYATRGGEVIFSNMTEGSETRDVVIGSTELIPGLERGLIGMRAGGERDISIPAALGFGGTAKMEKLRDHAKFKFTDAGGIITARASLISVEPKIPESDLQLRMAEQELGNGTPVDCGSEVYVRLTIWKMDGKQVYTNAGANGKPLHFTLGKSQVPYGIEQGIIGMMLGSKRTLIIPPDYATPLIPGANDALLQDVEIPTNEILLAVVQTLPAPEEKKEEAKPAAAEKPAAIEKPAVKAEPKPKKPAKKEPAEESEETSPKEETNQE